MEIDLSILSGTVLIILVLIIYGLVQEFID